MTRNDLTWAQVNRKKPVVGDKPNQMKSSLVLSKKTNEQRYSFSPITYLNKQNNALRFCKAVRLYFTTFYSWKNSWHAAAR